MTILAHPQAKAATLAAQKSIHLADRHRHACIEKRGLDPSWVEANCRSVSANEASRLLGYRAKSGGILLQGQGKQIQFKPDRPWKNEGDKKAPKYRSPLGDYDVMLPSHPENSLYWEDLEALKAMCFRINGHPCLVNTEGFFKATSGCSNGIPTIALMGVEMGLTPQSADIQGKRYLVPTLEHFAKAGIGFINIFDADCASNRNVISAQLKLGAQLLKFGVPVYSCTGLWSMEQGKGMDDFIQQNGIEKFKSDVLGNAITHEQWLKAIEKLEQDLGSNLKPAKSRYMQRKNAIRNLWGSRLQLNSLKQCVELDGEPLDLDFVRSDLCEALDIDIPKEEAVEVVLGIARENQYCPIQKYLKQCEAAHPDHGIDFQSLAHRLLGTTNPLDAAYLKRHLIGSVARALNPGCKMDTAWILQGKQGARKSTFFQTLYGDEFFDDTMAESSDKDELMKLHQHWAVEWAEFETTLGRKGYSRLKQFMTTRIDTYRPPYARTAKSFSRHTVLVGSTNEEEFLNDPSGDRRYWITRVVGLINIELTRQLRDRIWAAAVEAYRRGEQWWLTSEEGQWHDEANKPFRTEDTWELFIAKYIEDRKFITIAELLSKALEIEPAKQDKGSQMRAAAIMRRLGWHKGKQWHMGTWQRGWAAPDRSTDPPSDEVDREVDRSQNPNKINTSSNTDPPDPPLDQHFPKNIATHESSLVAAREISGKSLEKGGSVSEVDRYQDDANSVLPATDPPCDPPQQPDYSTYPHLTCNTTEAKRNQAEKIKQQLLDAESYEELAAIKQEFSTRCHWVWMNLLTKTQREKLEAIASVRQLDLLAPPPATEEAESLLDDTYLLDIAEHLMKCESREELDALHQCWSAEAMDLACKRLSPEKHAQIKQWDIELDAACG
jgi:predicted P-loop ATPase